MGTKNDAIPDPSPNEGPAFSSTSVLVRSTVTWISTAQLSLDIQLPGALR